MDTGAAKPEVCLHDRAGRQPNQFAWVHEIACPSENVLYVAELLSWRVRKLLLHP